MTTIPVPMVDTPDTSAAHELHHLTCCVDDDLALCGLDVSLVAWTSGVGEQPCIVCCHLEGYPTFCPKYGTCSE